MTHVSIWSKYSLNIEEASVYYGIGIKKLYEIVRENQNEDFLLEIGSHYRIKRVLFEDFLNNTTTL
ncbi:excisionase [Butyrivibrio sp. YAB3001]|uniref:excisionase n=1 Tax=Butyrivibrio sp. YAB3001 TaxID=1520812 RepID=UPI000B88ED4B